MLNIGMTELLIFGIITLLILGPEKLPEAIRFVGKWYGKIKRTMSNIQNDFDRELRLSELREQMQSEMKRIQELEAKMNAQMSELQQSNKVTQPINTQNQFSTLRFRVIETRPFYPLVTHPNRVKQIQIQTSMPTNYLNQSFNELRVVV